MTHVHADVYEILVETVYSETHDLPVICTLSFWVYFFGMIPTGARILNIQESQVKALKEPIKNCSEWIHQFL